MKKDSFLFDFRTLLNDNHFSEYKNKPIIIDNYEIKEITKSLNRVLGVLPEKEFFNFGKLKETKKKYMGFPSPSYKTIFVGNKKEKEKRILYLDFQKVINELIDLLDFEKKLVKLSLLPIVITNTGKKHKENIKVQLSIPEKVKIVKSESFPVPKIFKNLKDLNSKNSYLFNNIKHKQNSIVKEYYSENKMPQLINFGMSNIEQLEYEKGITRSLLNYYFDFNYYYDKPNKTIIECNFEKINTNETISFPAFIFFKSKVDFTIEYEITCKNEPEKIVGILEYKASS